MSPESKPGISVVSTYATDRLIDSETNEILKEQRGGPALFIVKALEASGLQPKVFTAEDMLVEILVEEDDEHGKIHQPVGKLELPEIDTDAAIVSTILDEWVLTNAEEYKGKLFVDIQGFVRDGSSFGKKKAWKDAKVVMPYVYCIKGNEIEVRMLPDEVIEEQKRQRMLIVTRGSNGVAIYNQGERNEFQPPRVVDSPHTIGAGDTWFANFVGKYVESNNVESSTLFANDKTAKFLSTL